MVDLIPGSIPSFVKIPIKGIPQPLLITFEYVAKKELLSYTTPDLMVYISNKEKEPIQLKEGV
jgi:hypothetical protein